MIEELKKELKRTPIEQLRQEWMSIQKNTSVGPKVSEVLQHWNNYYGHYHYEIKETLQNEIIKKTPKFSEFFF